MNYSRCCLVFGITSNLSFALGAFLVGFLKYHPDWNGSVHVFHNGLSDHDMDRIRATWPQSSFQLVDEAAVKKRLVGFHKGGSAVTRTISRYSTMYFAKFEMFDLLQLHEKCIWFDVDMVVLAAFPELWRFDDLAWRPVLKRTQAKHGDLKAGYAELLQSHPVSRPNGGLICASGKLWDNHRITAQSVYDIFVEIISKKPIVTGDEMSLMLLAAKNRLAVKELPMAYNCPSAARVVGHARVIHSIGRSKFWNDGGVAAAFPVWREYYLKWLAAGGSEYTGSVDEDYIPMDAHRIIVASRRFKRRRVVMLAVRDFIPGMLCPDPFYQGADARFYLVGLETRFMLRVAPVAPEDGAPSEKGMTLSFEVESGASERQNILAMLGDGSITLTGFSIDSEDSGEELVRFVRPNVPLASIGEILSELHAAARCISEAAVPAGSELRR